MGVIEVCLEIHLSTGENFGCTRKCRQTNTGITDELCKMTEFL